MERKAPCKEVINNAFYDDLGEEWLNRCDHPIALLRKENEIRLPWVLREILHRKNRGVNILDIGCGAGLLSNPLSKAGFNVTGIDRSLSSLEIAKKHDESSRATYIQADAYALPFSNGSYDVVLAMDILEHVENPYKLIKEASRVLKDNGLFFFHTFNRNLLSKLIIIKGVDWFVANAPKNMHVYSYFITPKELKKYCTESEISIDSWIGLQPKIFSIPMCKMLLKREVPNDFVFQFSKSLLTGYCGVGIKKNI